MLYYVVLTYHLSMGTVSVTCLDCAAAYHVPEPYHLKPSPVHELLYSNLSPRTNEQIDATRQTIQQLQTDLDVLDEDLVQMRIAFQDLLAKRSALHDYAEAHKAILSPLRRIPAEIMSEIFFHTLPHFPFQPSPDSAPLLLQRVCRSWRDVARSTPALWSFIKLSLRQENVRRDLAIASTWLARSGGYLLSIYLGEGGRNSSRVSWKHPVLPLLIAQCERWHTVHLLLPSRVLGELAGVKGRLRLLRSLYFFAKNIAEDSEHSIPFDIFASAPGLRHVQTSYEELPDIATNRLLILPWEGLTSLVIDDRRAEDILGILRDCSSLVELTAAIYDEPEDLVTTPNVDLYHLRSLSLILPESSAILSNITVPLLDVAHFEILKTNQEFDQSIPWHLRSGLDSLLSRSKCAIKTLRLRDEAGQFD